MRSAIFLLGLTKILMPESLVLPHSFAELLSITRRVRRNGGRVLVAGGLESIARANGEAREDE